MKLPDKIAGLRKSRGISQEELAERLGVSRQAVSRWETGSAKPDANNILQLSLLFHVTTDYLLHDDYQSDQDLPGIRKTNQILRTNLTLIAIIAQVSLLNVAMQPFPDMGQPAADSLVWTVRLVPLLACSLWMCLNLRYEPDPSQRRKNIRIELVYCLLQAGIALSAHHYALYGAGTALLLAVALLYILWVNPKFMGRPLTRKWRGA